MTGMEREALSFAGKCFYTMKPWSRKTSFACGCDFCKAYTLVVCKETARCIQIIKRVRDRWADNALVQSVLDSLAVEVNE